MRWKRIYSTVSTADIWFRLRAHSTKAEKDQHKEIGLEACVGSVDHSRLQKSLFVFHFWPFAVLAWAKKTQKPTLTLPVRWKLQEAPHKLSKGNKFPCFLMWVRFRNSGFVCVTAEHNRIYDTTYSLHHPRAIQTSAANVSVHTERGQPAQLQ